MNWVSVGEAMPRHLQSVAMFHEPSGGMLIGVYRARDKPMHFAAGFWSLDGFMRPVTHWAPLSYPDGTEVPDGIERE